MGCSSSKRGVSEASSTEKSLLSSNGSTVPTTPDSVPILVPVAGSRMRSSCPSTPDSASSMIILPLFPGKVTTPEGRSTLDYRRTTPPDQIEGQVPENVVIADHEAPLLYHKLYKLAAGNGNGPDSVLQHPVHLTTTATGNQGDADHDSAASQSFSGSSSDHSSARSTPTTSTSAIQETVTAALNSTGYVVVHAPSPPGSGTATPVHASRWKPKTRHIGQSPDTSNKSTDLAVMQQPKHLLASGGALFSDGTSKLVPAGITPANSRHTSRSSSPSSSPLLTPNKQPRHPKKVPLPSTSHYRHGHCYRQPVCPIPQNASTLRYASLDHSSVLSFSNLDSVNSFKKEGAISSGKQSVLKDTKVENLNVSGGLMNNDIHHGNSIKQHRDIVVINGSAVYVTNADGQKLSAFHQPSILPEEKINQLKPRVPIPVAMPIDGYSQPCNAGDAGIGVMVSCSPQKLPTIQGQTDHQSLSFKHSSITNIPVIQVGTAPTRLPTDFSGGPSESSSRVSSSNCNMVDKNAMAATFQEMIGPHDPLMASSWSTTPDRENLLDPNIMQRVLQECGSLEAKLGFYNGDAVLNSVEIEDEAVSFRSDSTSGDEATYKHLCA